MTTQSPKYSTSLLIRVGVTGHRTEGLQRAGYEETQLRVHIHHVLESILIIGSKFSSSPAFKVISPLAEGADRLVAETGLENDLNYELQCFLPFAAEEYEHDFRSTESKEEFRRLLQRATEISELKGDRRTEARAYENVGRAVLQNSDVLIAIWDGRPASGVGGTAQIVEESIQQDIIAIWIPPHEEPSILTAVNPPTSVSIELLGQRLSQKFSNRKPR